jgi:hypothetical protein
MQVHIEDIRKLRRASASIRDGGIIHVKVPHHWPKALKRSVIDELVERLKKKDQREKALLKKYIPKQASITLPDQEKLEAYVRDINLNTFNVPLGKVQIGNARYNHLAQVNLRTKTMTVSKYCLQDAPADALRYLIIHELAHYFESGHGPTFWRLVEQHVPDYRLQSRIIKAFHHQTVIGGENLKNAENLLSKEIQPIGTPSSKDKKFASKPQNKRSPQRPNTDSETNVGKDSKQNKTGEFIPGFIRQLLLWGKP